MDDKLNLHFYDGKISEARLLTSSDYDLNKLQNGYNKLVPYVPADKPNILNNINIILNDYKNNGKSKCSANYDISNDCHACELLSIAFDILFTETRTEEDFKGLLQIFLEQMDDMSTGLCPPGRTTRLAQFILTIKRD